MTRSEWYVGETAIDVPGYRWVRSDHKMHGPSTTSMAQVTLPGMDGELSIPSSHTVGAAEFALSVAFYGDSYEDMFDRKTQFERLIMARNQEIAITEVMPSGKRLTAYCYLTSASMGTLWDGDQDYLEVDYTFRIPSGVWLGPKVTFSISGTGTHRVPESLLGGSAPMYHTTIELTGTNADIILSPNDDGTAFFWFNGPVNGRTVINPRNATAAYGTGPTLTDASEYLGTGRRVFYIPAHGHIYAERASGATIKITTRKAYY